MAGMVQLPVYFRVGDGEEICAGTIEADSAEDAQASMADFLRAAADEIERALA